MKTVQAISILLSLTAAAGLTSCETTDGYADQDTAGRMSRRGAADDAISEARAEGMETQKNIAREQARMRQEEAAERERLEDIDTARRMSGGAGNSEFDRDARAAQNRADDIDTAERMMGRGAAN